MTSTVLSSQDQNRVSIIAPLSQGQEGGRIMAMQTSRAFAISDEAVSCCTFLPGSSVCTHFGGASGMVGFA